MSREEHDDGTSITGDIQRTPTSDTTYSMLDGGAARPDSASSTPLLLIAGDLLSERFVIQRLIGSGGMATIHRGLDLQTEQAVAVKVMKPSQIADAHRFAREVSVLAELSHPCIVRYIAHGQTPRGGEFLAMEWLEGEDLARRLVREPLSTEQSLLLLRRACSGLVAAHARGVVHRDLKPSNLFLVERDPAQLKLLDFGIARRTADTHTFTHSGAMLGTVGYMAPEQAMGLREVDTRADVFALGCVLFECLTGRAAFVGGNAFAVLAKLLREEPPRVSELRSGLGSAMDAFVARLLAKDPNDRPQNAAQVLQALDELETVTQHTLILPQSGVQLSAAESEAVSRISGRPHSEAVRHARFANAHQALERKTAELQAVLRALPDLYFLLDADGSFLDYSSPSRASLYTAPELFLGKHPYDCMPLEIAEQIEHTRSRVHATGELVTLEYELHVDGRVQRFEARCVPFEQQTIAIVRSVSSSQRSEAGPRTGTVRVAIRA